MWQKAGRWFSIAWTVAIRRDGDGGGPPPPAADTLLQRDPGGHLATGDPPPGRRYGPLPSAASPASRHCLDPHRGRRPQAAAYVSAAPASSRPPRLPPLAAAPPDRCARRAGRRRPAHRCACRTRGRRAADRGGRRSGAAAKSVNDPPLWRVGAVEGGAQTPPPLRRALPFATGGHVARGGAGAYVCLGRRQTAMRPAHAAGGVRLPSPRRESSACRLSGRLDRRPL